MKLNITTRGLEIIPEDKGYPNRDERDTAFIENVLGLKKNGDSILLIRHNPNGESCIAYLKTQVKK